MNRQERIKALLAEIKIQVEIVYLAEDCCPDRDYDKIVELAEEMTEILNETN